MEIVYVLDLPKGVMIRLEECLLVGLGQKEETHEGLCSQEGE